MSEGPGLRFWIRHFTVWDKLSKASKLVFWTVQRDGNVHFTQWSIRNNTQIIHVTYGAWSAINKNHLMLLSPQDSGVHARITPHICPFLVRYVLCATWLMTSPPNPTYCASLHLMSWWPSPQGDLLVQTHIHLPWVPGQTSIPPFLGPFCAPKPLEPQITGLHLLHSTESTKRSQWGSLSLEIVLIQEDELPTAAPDIEFHRAEVRTVPT